MDNKTRQELLDRYSLLSDDELLDIVLNAGTYQPGAPQIAMELISKRGIESKLLEESKEKREEDEAEYNRQQIENLSANLLMHRYSVVEPEILKDLEDRFITNGLNYYKFYQDFDGLRQYEIFVPIAELEAIDELPYPVTEADLQEEAPLPPTLEDLEWDKEVKEKQEKSERMDRLSIYGFLILFLLLIFFLIVHFLFTQ